MKDRWGSYKLTGCNDCPELVVTLRRDYKEYRCLKVRPTKILHRGATKNDIEFPEWCPLENKERHNAK